MGTAVEGRVMEGTKQVEGREETILQGGHTGHIQLILIAKKDHLHIHVKHSNSSCCQ